MLEGLRVEPADCFLCAASHSDPDELPWHDRPLVQEPEVGVAISAVGAFVPGYVVVAPTSHTRSVRDLAPARRAEVLDLVRRLRSRIEGVYGPTTIFEHGSCREAEGRRSACIAHSHIHIIPGEYGFGRLPIASEAFDSLDGMFAALSERPGTGYLMYHEPGGRFCCSVDPGIPQFFRRHIAAVLGEPDAWDYAAAPRWDTVRATQRMFAPPTVEVDDSVQAATCASW
jgi:diadenosine tetraphosphate (Ap4A) HIT family hydrolase